jgi:hypothetical protein
MLIILPLSITERQQKGANGRRKFGWSVHLAAVSTCLWITIHGEGRGGHQLFFAERAEGGRHIVVIHNGFRLE